MNRFSLVAIRFSQEAHLGEFGEERTAKGEER